MQKVYLYFLLLCFGISFAQEVEKTPEPLPRFSIRVNCGIPNSVSSKAFRTTFSAVISGEASVNCKLFSNFFVGIGYSYTYYQAQKYFRDLNVNTNMQSQNGYLKIGYDKFFSEKGFTTVSLNAGYNFNQYQGTRYKHDSLVSTIPTQFTSSFVEPQFGVYFVVDPNVAIGGHIGYNYNFTQFNPAVGGMNQWLDYSRISNKWNMSSIIIGFGFYYGIGKAK